MFKESIFHRAKNNFAYSYDENTVHIRIQTKKDDIKEIFLHCKDPFSFGENSWEQKNIKMKKIGSNPLFDFWQGETKPIYKRLEYYFELNDGVERVFFTERGFYTIEEGPKHPFKFPFLNKIDIFNAPEWVKDTVWYQIFPERFANGDCSINPKNCLEWGSEEPTVDSFFGGDLQGVINHLDYLVELGITGIYFTPIFKATSNHKYDTVDYLQIDPHFGTKDTLKELVNECHKRRIKVMLDAVFNHSGFYFEPFQDVVQKGGKSKYKDWFHIKEFPIKTTPKPNYETFAFTHMMPKLNTENPEVKQYLLNTAKYWIEECDIDGLRLDVSTEVDHQFWREFRNTVKNTKKDVYILGEIWHDSMPWLQGDQFDAVMNYPFTNLTLDLIASQSINVSEFEDGIEDLLYKYPSNVNEVSFNLLGSHDTARIMNLCGHDKRKVKLLFLLLLTFFGSPCIYYGDEIGLDGENDPGCRKCMEWNQNEQDQDIFSFVQKLINLRKNHNSLSRGEIIFHKNYEDVLVFEKRLDEKRIFILVNPSNQEKVFNFAHNHLLPLLNNGDLIADDKIKLPPFGYSVLRNE